MYESPINAICSEITHKILKDEEENMMLEVQKAIGYAVDKDELIKALRYDRNQYEKGFKDGAEQKAKWIPVSERLPEESGLYLVTLEYKEHGKGVTTLWYHGKQYGEFGWDLHVADVVIAWQPLPEPYKEAEDDYKNI